jgi:acetyl esterase/lipase
MNLTPVVVSIGVVVAVIAGVGIGRRIRAVAAIPKELRHPLLFVPSNITNGVMLSVARRIAARATAVQAGVQVEERSLPATLTGPAVKVHLYRSAARTNPGAALVWLHPGGLVMGAVQQSHAWCSRVAAELGVLVVNVDYRLAPEHPYPAAIDDAYGALHWLHANAAGLDIDPSRIAVGAQSAGAGLAATLAQRAHDENIPVRFQLLQYPMLDDRTTLRDSRGDRTVYWTPRSNRFAWTAYLGREPQLSDDRPYIAAARRTDLAGLAPAWIGVGDIDLFYDEDIEYAQRLQAAGVHCDVHIEPGMYHAADEVLAGKNVPSMLAFRDRMIAALDAALNKSPSPKVSGPRPQPSVGPEAG